MKKILYSLLFCVLALSSCNEGILDTSAYSSRAQLAALNFKTIKSTIDETSTTAIEIPLSLYNYKTDSYGTVKVKITSTSIYGTDYTTMPEAVDNIITLNIAKGDSVASFTVLPVNDLQSITNKTLAFALTDGQENVVVGGIPNHELTIINKNISIAGLIILPTPSTEQDFGIINNGVRSAAKKITFTAQGLTENVIVKTSSGYLVSTSESGNYGGSIEVQKSVLDNNASMDVWVVFAPMSGLDGSKSGTLTLFTKGTTGIIVPLKGEEAGNVGPYTYYLSKNDDGFFNTSPSKMIVGNKAAMSLNYQPILLSNNLTYGDIYYRFNLSTFAKPMDKVGLIELRIKSQHTATIDYTMYQIAVDWKETPTVNPSLKFGDFIQSGSIAFTANEFVSIDITNYVKAQFAANKPILNFVLHRTDSREYINIYGANSNPDKEPKWGRIIINDK